MNTQIFNKVEQIIRLYVAHRHSGDVRQEVRAWWLSDFHVEEKEAALQKLWDEALAADTKPDAATHRSYKRLMTKIGKQAVRIPMRRHWLRAAAVLLPIAALAGLSYFYSQKRGGQALNGLPFEAALSLVVTTNKKGQQVICPDSSTIWANGNSQIEYYDDRSVKLKGEAYFEVNKGLKTPFKVQTNAFTAIVLGTKFNIEAYPDNACSIISLYEGGLRVETSQSSVEMKAGERLVCDHATGQTTLRQLDDRMPQWLAGEVLSFDRVSYETIFEALTKYYDVQFVYDRAGLKDKTITLRLDGSESIEDILYMLSQIDPTLKYRRENNQLIIISE